MASLYQPSIPKGLDRHRTTWGNGQSEGISSVCGSRASVVWAYSSQNSRGSIVLVVTVTMSVAEKKQVWRKILGDFQEGQPLCSSSTSSDCVCFLTSFNKHSIDKTSSVNLLSTRTMTNTQAFCVRLFCKLLCVGMSVGHNLIHSKVAKATWRGKRRLRKTRTSACS